MLGPKSRITQKLIICALAMWVQNGTSLESSPFPQTPPGLSGSGVVGSGGSVGSLTPAQQLKDPARAFQAINAETLELASQNVDYPVPSQNVSLNLNTHYNSHCPHAICLCPSMNAIAIAQPLLRRCIVVAVSDGFTITS